MWVIHHGKKRVIGLVEWSGWVALPEGGHELRRLRRRWLDPFFLSDHLKTVRARWRARNIPPPPDLPPGFHYVLRPVFDKNKG